MMKLFAKVVAESATAAFDKDSCGCGGATAAFGFGNAYTADPYSVDMYSSLFTKGLPDADNKERYQHMMEHLPENEKAKLLHGERLFPTKERAVKWIAEEVPVYPAAEQYAVLKPLSRLQEHETPLSVIFTVNPLELSALIAIAGSITEAPYLSATPQGAACQMIASLVQQQAKTGQPRGVLGLLDLSPRPLLRPLIPDNYLTYSVPWEMFLELEQAAQGGVLTASIWSDAISGAMY